MVSRAYLVLALNLGLVFSGAVIRDLTEDTFDDFIQMHDKAMIDFVRGTEQQTEELLNVERELADFDAQIPIARVNVDKQVAISKRYFKGCDEEKQLCADSFPRLLWFVNGKATQYHRSLRSVQNILSFSLAMNRDYISTVSDESQLEDFNRYLLFRGKRSSTMYKTLEHIAAQHMDTLAVRHIEEQGSNVSWILNGTLVETFAGADDEDSVESWIRQHFVFGEAAPENAIEEDGSVHVVASTFERQVLRNDTDVFLLVYAPWCGYSRKVLPEWSKLSRNASAGSLRKLVVAKMDGAQNRIDVAEYKWTTFPQILYFRTGDKKPLLYEGDRSAEALAAFAQRNLNTGDEGDVLLQPRLRGGRREQPSAFLQRQVNGALDL